MTSLSPGLHRQSGYPKSLRGGFKSDRDTPLLQPRYPLSITHRINLGSYLRSGPGCSSGTWPALLLCSHSVPGLLAVPGTCWMVSTLWRLRLRLPLPGMFFPRNAPSLTPSVSLLTSYVLREPSLRTSSRTALGWSLRTPGTPVCLAHGSHGRPVRW